MAAGPSKIAITGHAVGIDQASSLATQITRPNGAGSKQSAPARSHSGHGQALQSTGGANRQVPR
jgi:hypothetical protein